MTFKLFVKTVRNVWKDQASLATERKKEKKMEAVPSIYLMN